MSTSKTQRTMLTLDTLEEALEELSKLPDTERTRELRARGEILRADVTKWTEDSPPTPQERDAEMQQVLAYYMEVERLARGS